MTTQVDGYCPLCPTPLFYRKNAREYKQYEIAHIYPLNPTKAEVAELNGVHRLHSDVNHPDNLLPLCTACHNRFDKPRTRAEYEELAAKKRKLIADAAQRALSQQYPLENDISLIIERLHSVDLNANANADLELHAKSLENKFDASMPMPTRRKIKHAVTDYYQFVKTEFRELERIEPNASQLIFSQIRAFYLKQKTLNLSQADIFKNVVAWIQMKSAPQTTEAAEIVASFFVQNCEVFE